MLAKKHIEDLLSINDNQERAIEVMTYLMRAQLFMDGNKRIVQLVANQIMIHGGGGIIAIPVENNIDFFDLLIKYYETNDNSKLKKFINTRCIDGYNHINSKDIKTEDNNYYKK